ncbi:MAG: hypothetical protein ABR905_05440 [Terracidiphilus sp.]|jgi:hypothetical protein
MRNTTQIAAFLLVSLALAGGVAGCRVHVDKDANGEEKKVQVDTPFGGVHVNTDQTSAVDLGLPVYPGAEIVKGDDEHKSADVHLGFGDWELRVRAVSYETSDSQDKVTDFYKKALGRFGDVITCQSNAPVGTPAATREGLTCSDNDKHSNVQIDQGDYHLGKGNLELKAGSKRHQHIVGFEKNGSGGTRFALVALDLPASVENGSGKSD